MVYTLLWLMSFLFFTSIGYLFLLQLFKNKMIMYRRLAPLLTNNNEQNMQEQKESIQNKTLYERLIRPMVLKIRHFTVGKLPKQRMEQIDKKLQAAGYPFGLSAGDFVLLQYALPLVMFSLFIAMFLPTSDEKLKVVVLSGISALFTYVYTNYYLTAKSKVRIKMIEKAMPDFFDMLNVSIEAGMGLDGALKKVCGQMNTPLSAEFLSALEDMKLGKSRRQAFIELRERVPSDFFRSVMNSIIQADQMGIGMSKVLRTQTTRIREKQRFAAKEKAMKAPVKMLIPMVLFIFPTLFIVLIGPVIVNLVTQFL
ncbi:type II secretion system F family protein [Bacillus sp. Marseille-P3661]|uniref:type II secretion system F family protein n=1 Tax=Bacillus sp. Marseille-P3661 TaxID=1936234 RepID=UPI000C836299|nr:type II secretion system F family protein [Bacillus sp. Marseille-P3661]